MEVAVFAAKSEPGLQLAQMIRELLANKDVELHIGNRFEEELKQEHFLYACINMDLVIFDATREEETNNFDLANELMKHLPHVVIVSRNYLPVNLFSVLKGGYPDYLKGEMTNTEIIIWLRQHLASLLRARPQEDKEIESQAAVIQRAISEQRKKQVDQTNVFISYRTKYEKKSNGMFPADYQLSVYELAEKIKNGSYHVGEGKTVKYLGNGRLAYHDELLTEHRMWQLLSIIDNELIMNCDEFWIYGSEDYASSWWTQGELAVLAYVLQMEAFVEPFNQKKILKYYDPRSGEVFEISPEYYPKLSPEEIKKVARLHTTTSPNQMGPESNQMKNRLKRFAFLFRSPLTSWIFKPLFRRVFDKQMEVHKKLNTPLIEDEADFDTIYQMYFSKAYMEDKPFSKTFWQELKFLPPIQDEAITQQGNNRRYNFDFSSFFAFIGNKGVTVDMKALANDVVEVAGRSYQVVRENDRYYFSPSRLDRDFSTTQRNLEIVPVYRLVGLKTDLEQEH